MPQNPRVTAFTISVLLRENQQGGEGGKITPLPPITQIRVKKETLAQVFSCKFCEVFKSTFFIEYLWWLLLKIEDNR